MQILIVKLSSFGDIIHTFPAITDIMSAYPDAKIDWLVDERFAEVVTLHPAIRTIIPVALKRWKKSKRQMANWKELGAAIKKIRHTHYDAIIDAQGLLKSALLASWIARGKSHGFCKAAIREALASRFYSKTHAIDPTLHVGEKIRALCASSLQYDYKFFPQNYNIQFEPSQTFMVMDKPFIVIAHATTWPNKFYSPNYWKQIIKLAAKAGYAIYLPWGNQTEKLKAEQLAQASEDAHPLLKRLSLPSLSYLLTQAKGVITVDTGIGHLAGALGVPTVGLYGPSSAALSGPSGAKTHNLQADFPCSPCLKRECFYHGSSEEKPACFDTLTPQTVWSKICGQLANLNSG